MNLFSRRRGGIDPNEISDPPPAPSGSVDPVTAAVPPPRPAPVQMPGATPGPSSAPGARNLPAALIPAVAPMSHPRPQVDEEDRVIEHRDEAAEFVERLGDLDRFIGGDAAPSPSAFGATSVSLPSTAAAQPLIATAPRPAAVAPVHAPATDEDGRPAPDPEDEAQEFLDRLGDLDRFIGGTGSA